jgi:energy-coupling factor transporter ATP-binding protein EcfA2
MATVSDSKGSTWRKWDLHIHSPLSGLANNFPMNEDGTPDWEQYIAALEALPDIPAIAITDYFLIDGYKKVREFKNQGRLPNIKLLLPNIEFRLDNIVGGKRINFHVIFSDEVTPEDIDDHFISNLNVALENDPWQQPDIRKLKRRSLEELGEKRKAEHASFRDRSDFEIGCLTAVTKLDEMMNILNTTSLFRGRYLTGVAEENMSLMDWNSQDHGVRKVIMQSSHLLFSANPNSIAWCLGKKHPTPDDYVQEFKTLKPCIIGSDAHELSKIGVPPNGRYTWIKSDVSFEGLKQIIYEPELRVRIQSDNPSEEEAYAQIESLEVNFPSELLIKDKHSNECMRFCIQGKQTVAFSSNLTCIIGGRGSGKSTLVHLLYNVSRDVAIERLVMVNSPLSDLQLGTKDTLSKVRSFTKMDDLPLSTEFFLQNEVEKFAKDINEMSKLVKSRLYALSAITPETELIGLETGWDIAAGECERLTNAYDNITNINEKIDLLTKQKATLKKQTEVITSQEYKTLQSEIEQCAVEISSFKTFEKEVKQLLLQVSSLTETIAGLNWGKYEGQSVLRSLSTQLAHSREELERTLAAATGKHAQVGYEQKAKEKTADLKKFLIDKGLSSENIGEVAGALQNIADLDEQIKALGKEKLPYEHIYSRKDDILQTHQEAYASYKDAFEKVTNVLQQGLTKLKFDDQEANISFQLQVDEEGLRDWVAKFVKENNPFDVSLRADFIKNVIFGVRNVQVEDLVSDRSKIVEIVNASTVADVHTQILQELVTDEVFVERLHLHLHCHYYDIQNIQVQTRLGDKSLQSTSFGERCGIVIAIVLVAGTNPIVIDQPEDNLDGKYISKVLVPLLREQKQRRQIILVTRDANIVVGGDSELIIILAKGATQTAILPATIEDRDKRSDYIWILDGGEKAFQKREAKYSIET